MEKREKVCKGNTKRSDHGSNGIRVRDASGRDAESGYRSPLHMEPAAPRKKRNVGFAFFALAACGAWPCILMYVVTAEPLFMALVCACIAAMVLSLMFEQGEYYE